MQLHRNLFIAMLVATANTAMSKPVTADLDGALGLYASSDMQLASGTCQTCPTIPQAKWYFEQDLIAVPSAARPVAGYSPAFAAQQDVRQWISQPGKDDLNALPPLVWLGSSQVVTQATLEHDGKHIKLESGEIMGFGITPKISTNLSYYDASSQ
jgi:hypothetical protein